jgi:uncharacterized protein
MSQQFGWDAAKAAVNLKKHRVGFDEALTVFANPLARIFDDPDHSATEKREIIVGHSVAQRLLVVAFMERNDQVRIITARSATARERKTYEENTNKSERQ